MKISPANQLNFLLLCSALGNAAWANEFSQLTITAGHEDNVPRVASSPAAAESGFVTATFSAGAFQQIGLNHTLTFSAALQSRRYIEHPGFDAISVGLTGAYGYKFGLGAYAPRLGLSVSASKEEIDGEARDRRLLVTALSASKRLSPYLQVSGGVDYQVSRGSSLTGDPRLTSFGYAPGEVVSYALFDDDARTAFAQLDYDLPNGMLLSAGYSRSSGFVVSSTQNPTLHIYKLSDAVYVDPSWPDLWFAYRLQSDTDDYRLNLSTPVSRDSAIDIGVSWQRINGPSDLDYKNRTVSISFVHNF